MGEALAPEAVQAQRREERERYFRSEVHDLAGPPKRRRFPYAARLRPPTSAASSTGLISNDPASTTPVPAQLTPLADGSPTNQVVVANGVEEMGVHALLAFNPQTIPAQDTSSDAAVARALQESFDAMSSSSSSSSSTTSSSDSELEPAAAPAPLANDDGSEYSPASSIQPLESLGQVTRGVVDHADRLSNASSSGAKAITRAQLLSMGFAAVDIDSALHRSGGRLEHAVAMLL